MPGSDTDQDDPIFNTHSSSKQYKSAFDVIDESRNEFRTHRHHRDEFEEDEFEEEEIENDKIPVRKTVSRMSTTPSPSPRHGSSRPITPVPSKLVHRGPEKTKPTQLSITKPRPPLVVAQSPYEEDDFEPGVRVAKKPVAPLPSKLQSRKEMTQTPLNKSKDLEMARIEKGFGSSYGSIPHVELKVQSKPTKGTSSSTMGSTSQTPNQSGAVAPPGGGGSKWSQGYQPQQYGKTNMEIIKETKPVSIFLHQKWRSINEEVHKQEGMPPCWRCDFMTSATKEERAIEKLFNNIEKSHNIPQHVEAIWQLYHGKTKKVLYDDNPKYKNDKMKMRIMNWTRHSIYECLRLSKDNPCRRLLCDLDEILLQMDDLAQNHMRKANTSVQRSMVDYEATREWRALQDRSMRIMQVIDKLKNSGSAKGTK